MIDYLKHFTGALQSVMRETGFEEIDIDVADSGSIAAEIVASVGITGDLKGFMMLRSDLKSANSFVAQMLTRMGIEEEPEDGFGQMQKEAIGEIVNQISGRSTMMLAEQHIDCNITPPTIISGQNIYTDLTSCESSVSHLLKGSFGVIGLFIGIKSSDLKR
jgi:chemotaxis protein CheX